MSKKSLRPEKNATPTKPAEADKTLKSSTTEELIRELGRRRAKAKANVEANRRGVHNIAFVIRNVQELLDLTPKHECMGCTDEAPGNYHSDAHGNPCCTRCRLLTILNEKANDETVLVVRLRDWKPLVTDEAALRDIASE